MKGYLAICPGYSFSQTGMPTDNIETAIDNIRFEENRGKNESGKLRFVSIGVPGADLKVLSRISPNRCIEVRNNDFSSICDWIAENLNIISFSSVSGKKPMFNDLPENSRIVPSSFLE